jgi:hypothetical protein
MKRTIATIGLTAALVMVMSTAAIAAGSPTCGGLDLGDGDPIANHGEHVTRHYVFGHDGTNAAGGAALPGGPGPAFHFENGIAPGASFCVEQSQVDGWHVGD